MERPSFGYTRRSFVVRVTDAEGRRSDRALRVVVANVDPGEMHERVPWLHEAPAASAAPPAVRTANLPRGAVGQAYRAILEASGGTPFDQVHEVGEATTDGRRTRYWEFAFATLEREILEDNVILGAGGTAKPRINRLGAGRRPARRRRPGRRPNSVAILWLIACESSPTLNG
jgi:hypothetical protein